MNYWKGMNSFEKYLANKSDQFIPEKEIEKRGVIIGSQPAQESKAESKKLRVEDIEVMVKGLRNTRPPSRKRIELINLLRGFKPIPTKILASKLGYKNQSNLRQLKLSTSAFIGRYGFEIQQTAISKTSYYKLIKHLTP